MIPFMAIFSTVQKKMGIAMGITIVVLLTTITLLARYVLTLKEEQGVLIQQNTQYVQAISDLSMQIADLRIEAERIDKILVDKDRAIAQLRVTAKKAQDDIVNLASSTPEIKVWSDSPVPAVMVDRLFAIPTERAESDSGKTVPAKVVNRILHFPGTAPKK